MFKISILILILFWGCLCHAQNYIAINDVYANRWYGDDIDTNIIHGGVDVDYLFRAGERLRSTDSVSDIIVHDKPDLGSFRFERIRRTGWIYDSCHHHYLASDSFLKVIRSEYYYHYLHNAFYRFDLKYGKVEILGPNQNSSSPECKLDKGDSAVGTIRYRVVCTDCPYPKKKKLYYIFYYDKNGAVVRHGLAYLKKK